MTRTVLVLCALFFIPIAALNAEDEKVFSGPQAGEKLSSFTMVGVYDKLAGKEIDPIKDAGGKPITIIFMHPDLTRPAAGVIRAITAYSRSQAKKGIRTYVVWLTDDRTKAEAYLKLARRSLQLQATVGISKDGLEGPGAYGLNRKMSLTVLVGKDNKVTNNFALIQPSMEADAPKIAQAMAKLIDVKAPTADQLEEIAFPGRSLGVYFRQLRNKNLPAERVKRTAAALEKLVADNPARQKALADFSANAIEKNFGGEAALEYFKTWAKKYGSRERR